MNLTRKERRICELLVNGYQNRDIAQELGMKHRTVKAYFHRMFVKHGIRSGIKRVKLAVLFYRTQLELECRNPNSIKLLSLAKGLAIGSRSRSMRTNSMSASSAA